ncbi:MAG: thioesterase family protein [Pseudomonas sp.]|uniref:thioesterase family protein n=1 Tax=Pseudomonas sp. TaxID=306 RepID=UPI0033965FE2
MPAPLTTYQTLILPEWTDYNGHLRDAFYLLVFSYATDALMDHLGLDSAHREASGHSLFTLECHLNYLHEVRQGSRVQVRTQLLGHDHKRLHLYHSLHLGAAAQSLAASEQLLLHVALGGADGARSAAFSGEVARRIEALGNAHRHLPRPAWTGRVIGLPA